MKNSPRLEIEKRIDYLFAWFPEKPLCLCARDQLTEIQLALEPGAILSAALVDLAQGGMCHIAEQRLHIHQADQFPCLRESF